MNMKECSMNHYHLVNDALIGNQKWEGKEDMISIVLLGLSQELPEHDENYELHRLLGTLLSKSLTQKEKLNIIEKEYDIPLEDEFRKEVASMCNLSQGIVDDTKAEIVMNMYKKGYSLKQISESVDIDAERVETIIKEKESVFA